MNRFFVVVVLNPFVMFFVLFSGGYNYGAISGCCFLFVFVVVVFRFFPHIIITFVFVAICLLFFFFVLFVGWLVLFACLLIFSVFVLLCCCFG